MLWQEEGRLILMMPAFAGEWDLFVTKGKDDAYDGGFEPMELHFLSPEVRLMLVMLA